MAFGAGALNLKVVYPKPDQVLPPVDSTFIFGSVEPGSELTVNGLPVEVHKDGGWLAFVPVNPGPNTLIEFATKDNKADTLFLPIFLPALPQYTYDSLFIDPASISPVQETILRAGDELKLSFRGTPYCNAYCVIEPLGDTVLMTEAPPRNYYGGKNVFMGPEQANNTVPDSLLIRGIYEGTYVIPETDSASLTLCYNLYPPDLQQIVWRQKYSPYGGILPVHQLMLLEGTVEAQAEMQVNLLGTDDYTVVELKDTLTVIRTGPRRGYLCFNQPAGIRARLTGKLGRWCRIQLAPYQSGWIPDTSFITMPPGTPVPHSYLSRITTVNDEDMVSVRFATSARHAFRIIENMDEPSITIYLYGVDSDTDWIRYDNLDKMINHAVWFQDEPGVYALKIYLNEKRIWGYDAHYVENELWLDIKKHPADKNELADFRFVIDPGHSPDLGAVGPTGLTEAEANLGIALALKKELEKNRATVIMTRNDSSPVPLYDRPKIAKRVRADIFISIHNNALPDGTNPFENNGISVFYYNPHSADLAHFVHSAMVCKLDMNDFGWYYGNLAVNRPTQYPAILVECAFMMIPDQEAALKTDKFRRKVAKAIVAGIKDYLRGHRETSWDRILREQYGR